MCRKKSKKCLYSLENLPNELFSCRSWTIQTIYPNFIIQQWKFFTSNQETFVLKKVNTNSHRHLEFSRVLTVLLLVSMFRVTLSYFMKFTSPLNVALTDFALVTPLVSCIRLYSPLTFNFFFHEQTNWYLFELLISVRQNTNTKLLKKFGKLFFNYVKPKIFLRKKGNFDFWECTLFETHCITRCA